MLKLIEHKFTPEQLKQHDNKIKQDVINELLKWTDKHKCNGRGLTLPNVFLGEYVFVIDLEQKLNEMKEV